MRNQVFKKLFSVLLALIMVAGLLPASVLAEGWTAADVDSTPAPAETVQPTESAEPTEPAETETPEVTEVPEPTPENPATTDEPAAEPAEGEEPAEPVQEETPAPEDGILLAAENVTARDTSKDGFYRIVHLDCGRKYFSKEWIIALMREAKAAGYNQIQLAFGNKGLRLLLDDMSVTVNVNGETKTYLDQDVTNAVQAGNKAYNNAVKEEETKANELTQSEMDEIFKAAEDIGIEIVPLFNTPFHMEAVITAMGKLGISNAYYGSNEACLNLSNDYATAFVKALMQKYITYFKDKGCKYFNFGADEYTGGWDDTFYSYANSIVTMISKVGMTARIFNDSFRSDSNNGYVKDAQVCYWSSNSGYASTATVYNYAKDIINTNQDFYYVVNKDTQQSTWKPDSNYAFSGSFDETTWVNYAKNFSNTTYKNFANYNDGAEKITPVGSMFCIWCDNPSHKDETQIAKEIRMILRVIGARMQDDKTAYADSSVLVEGGFKENGEINVTVNNITVGDKNGNATLDDTDAVRVTGPELAKLDCEEVKSEITGINAAEGKMRVYNVTPETEDKKYTGEAEVSIKIPAEWDKTKVCAFVVNDDDTVTLITGKVVDENWYVFTAPHFSVMGIYVQAVTYVEETVTVVVGGSEKVTIEGYDYSEQVGEIDTSIATVQVTYEGVTVSEFTPATSISADAKYIVKYGDKYIDENGNLTDNISEAAEWTYERYSNVYGKLKNSKEQYLTYQSSGSFNAVTSYQNNSWLYVNGTTVNMYSGSSYNIALSLGTKTEGSSQPSTIITFTGVAEGTTSVVIGGTRYTVKVKAKELGEAKLYVDFWVTSNRVKPNNLDVVSAASIYNKVSTADKRYYHEFTAANSKFASEEGVLLTDLIPSGGEYTNTTDTTGTANTIDAMLWKVRYLPQAYRQTAAGWTNKSGFGTDTVTGEKGGVDIERIRYYENKWQYKAVGGTDWVEFTTSMDESGNQIAAYYLLKTEVTTQVTTYITDWPDPQTEPFYGVALDYCVKYESDSTRNPNTFGKATNINTQWFNCVGEKTGDPIDNGYTLESTDTSIGDWEGNGSNKWYRVINNIRAVETDKYEIYMVTATPSDMFSSEGNQKCPDSITYPKEGEKVIWAENEDVVSTSGLTAHGEIKYGGTPDINRVVIQQCTGMLITYYVRAKANASLTVHYIDDTAGGTEFYKYGIVVDSNTLFSENIDFNKADGVLNNYTVKNNDGDTQKIESDLQSMPKIDAQYRYSKYKCVSVKRSDDGKDFYLHYTFDNNVTFVVDFGLPLKVTPAEVNKELARRASSVNVTQKNVEYGTVTVDGAEFTYTLNKMINGYETIVAEYSGVNTEINIEGKVAYNVYIIPATTVYYEDSFATFYNANKEEQKEFKACSDDDTAGVWYIDGDTITVDQALEALGQKSNVYGYDPKYDNYTKFSMGSARKVTVNTNGEYAQAKFTFKGTGFDVISLTNNNSGAITVEVFDKEGKTATTTAGKDVFYLVNNYYGYTYNENTGEWTASPDTTQNAIYQVPVIKVKDLAYGEYTAVITVDYASFFDKTGDSQYSFWLDAVRVYNPAGNTLDTEYGKDDEAKPVYTEVRKALIGQGSFVSKDATNVTGAVFIDGKATGATIEDYTNYGPNHEVYLAQWQAIAFKIVADSQPKTVQLGVKLANGNSGTLNIGGDGIKFAAYNNNKDAANSLELTTATDMYYALTGLTWIDDEESEEGKKVSNLIVLTNNSANIISITNVKCTFEAAQEAETNTVALAISYDDALTAVSMVNNLLAPEPEPEPEKTFEPERFEASWTKNVMQGRKATLTVKTSEDVEAITVDGQTIRSYRTRTERVGFGRRAKRITYREFTFSMVAQETADFSITAINAEGIESEAITARLTVQKRPSSVRDVWNWFKGWF